jgi:NAD(P)-dependent dehydrogenase (short-subunit alcohol dehydrogenase family)
MKNVILVTGASAGIGTATVKLLLAQGHTVYAAARRVERMKDLEELGAKLLQMDVTDDESMVRGVQQIINAEKKIDVLVNNAGYGSYGSLEEVPMSEAKYQFEVNVFGLARLTQLVVPYMRKQGSGRIINVSSMGGVFGEPHGSWYHATKFAVEGLSDSIRMELKQFGIDVVVIRPGAIKTEWNGIARENLLKVSGNGPYKELVQKHANMLHNADGRFGSEPIVVAKAIARAVAAGKPRTRYAIGQGAKFSIFMRWLLPDRAMDKVMNTLIKSAPQAK